MLILLPPSLAPWCVAVGTALGAAVKASRGARHVSRLVPAVAQFSLPVLAPAAVLAVSPPVSSWADAPVIAAALGVYIAADLAISLIFARLAHGQPLALPSPAEAWVYGIDLLLAPVGIAMAIAAEGRLWAVAVVFLPLAFLLRVFANERRSRLDHALELSLRTEAPRCCSATWSRATTPTPARTAATSSRSPSRSARGWGSRASACATWSSARSCTTSARSPCPRRSSTSPAR